MMTHYLPEKIPETAMVGEGSHLISLMPLSSGDGHFLQPPLSQNLIKIYGADQWHLWEYDTSHARDAIPTSVKEVQQRSSVVGEAQFHGHGTSNELDKAATEWSWNAALKVTLATSPPLNFMPRLGP